MAPGHFRDYRELHVPLRLPIYGTTYVIPPVGADTGALLAIAAGDDKEEAEAATLALNAPLPDAEDTADGKASGWYRRMLSSAVYEAMVAADVPWQAIERAARTALADHQLGRLAALAVWDVAADPKGWAALLEATAKIQATP